MTDPHELARRYIQLWNEPDRDTRRTIIRELWTENGAHVLHPPEEIRKAAAGLGFVDQALEVKGYDALEARVAKAYEDFVASGEYTFAARGAAVRLRDVVKLEWHAVRRADGEAVGGGIDVLVLDADGRISADYQFPD